MCCSCHHVVRPLSACAWCSPCCCSSLMEASCAGGRAGALPPNCHVEGRVASAHVHAWVNCSEGMGMASKSTTELRTAGQHCTSMEGMYACATLTFEVTKRVQSNTSGAHGMSVLRFLQLPCPLPFLQDGLLFIGRARRAGKPHGPASTASCHGPRVATPVLQKA